jgi:hypothetical protein
LTDILFIVILPAIRSDEVIGIELQALQTANPSPNDFLTTSEKT